MIGRSCHLFYWCARQGALRASASRRGVAPRRSLGGEKSSTDPDEGSRWPDGEGVTVRWGPKEAASKVPARRIEIAYEASRRGREGQYLQSPIVIRRSWCVLPGGVCGSAARLPLSRGDGMDRQKSAEVIVTCPTNRRRTEPVGAKSPTFCTVLGTCLARGPKAGSSGRNTRGKAGHPI